MFVLISLAPQHTLAETSESIRGVTCFGAVTVICLWYTLFHVER